MNAKFLSNRRTFLSFVSWVKSKKSKNLEFFLQIFDNPNKLMAGTQKSTPIEKENQLPNHHFQVPNTIFQGVLQKEVVSGAKRELISFL